ncbi:MAG: aminopeptidase [Clostridia bacterium]|nr:aminopeptidase [Clostridia bacterium]
MSETKSEAELLKEQLFYKPQHADEVLSDADKVSADEFCEGYKDFLNAAKTEREATAEIIRMAEENGFKKFSKNFGYEPGDKVYFPIHGKAVILTVFGRRSVAEGVKIAAAHIDSPRLDLKPNPLYEDTEIGYFKTHYYGGIRKYQWPAIPLALHGVVVKSNGEKVSVRIGEDAGDPKFVISDLLPHLGAKQSKRSLAEGIQGEELNIIIGSRKFNGCESDAVKLAILKALNDKYGITERDFQSAEIEAIPAFKADDIGFDRSMIGAYGQDDRVCAYPAVVAALDIENPEYTCLSVLTDKEEIGSEGNTGLESRFLAQFIEDLANLESVDVNDALRNSECLSADVNAAYDPTFSDVFEKRNSAFLNKGVVITKYTGARGKSGTNDASAEYMGKVRGILDGENILWQTGELGKVDAGGGGTVAMYISHLGVNTVDLGVPVLSMHSPYELTAKYDIYMAYKAFCAFFKSK